MKWILTLVICLSSNLLVAQYKPVQNLSSVVFTVKYFGVAATGSIGGLRGDISWGNDESFVNNRFNVSIDASTIQTGIDLRDEHLRGGDFFDVTNHPQIRFVSSKVEAADDNGTFTVVGELTIKNHKKEVSFPFTAEPIVNGYLFRGSFQINRKDFDVGKSVVISDSVEVVISVSATK